MRKIVVIPAGGSGVRTGLSLPKQYLKVNGKEIIAYTLTQFQNCNLVDEIIVSANPAYHNLLLQLKQDYSFTKLSKVTNSGDHRQDTVFNTLAFIATYAKPDDLVIVHDAVRPLVTDQILKEAIKTAEAFGSAVVCLKAKDTLVKTEGEAISEYLNRDRIYQVQTPQIFQFQLLKEAFDAAYAKNIYATDESALVKRLHHKVIISEGSSLNFKITTKEDIEMFEAFVKEHPF